MDKLREIEVNSPTEFVNLQIDLFNIKTSQLCIQEEAATLDVKGQFYGVFRNQRRFSYFFQLFFSYFPLILISPFC